jgi:hypothetical protein
MIPGRMLAVKDARGWSEQLDEKRISRRLGEELATQWEGVGEQRLWKGFGEWRCG